MSKEFAHFRRPADSADCRCRRRAFTLIEILVVMSIILVLIGLFLAGYKSWIDSADRSTTLARLEALNAMLTELDSSGHNQFLTQWFIPADLNAATPGAFALDAAQFGNVTADGASETITTSSGLQTINCSRSNALAYMTFAAGTYPINEYPEFTSFHNAVDWFLPQPSSYKPSNSLNEGLYYGIMTRLAILPNAAKTLAGMPSTSMAYIAMINGKYNADYPSSSNNISLINLNPPPVLLDGWGNPILFCPGSGLANVNNTMETVGGMCDVYVNFKNNSAVGPTTVSAPDGRPFFVSAGPDGDFAKGDDNIYSFNPQ